MAEEMRDHVYVGTEDGNRKFVTDFIPAASLPVATNAFFSRPAFVNGMARQSFKVIVTDESGAGAGTWIVQERVNGVWVDKNALGAATMVMNKLTEHTGEDMMRECRIKATFTANPDGNPGGATVTTASHPFGVGKPIGIYMEISGRRDI